MRSDNTSVGEGFVSDIEEHKPRLFRERQFFIRSNGKVRFVTVGAATQISAAVMAVGLLGWTAYASWNMVDTQERLDARISEIMLLENEQRRLENELASVQAHFANATAEITRHYRDLQRLVSLRSDLEEKLSDAKTQLAELEERRDVAEGRGKELQDRAAALANLAEKRRGETLLLNNRLQEMASALAGAQAGRDTALAGRDQAMRTADAVNETLADFRARQSSYEAELNQRGSTIQRVESERDVARAEILRLGNSVATLRGQLDTANRTNSDLHRRLAATADTLTQTQEFQVSAEQRGSALANTVSQLEQRLDDVRKTQIALLNGVRDKTRRSVTILEDTLAVAGLDADTLLTVANQGKPGVGGPFVTQNLTTVPEGGSDDGFEEIVVDLENRLARWENLQRVLEHMPLAGPTTRGYVSSGYGRRRDPFTRKAAYHKGIDIAAPPRTSVYATAPATVKRAGKNGAYGLMVELDHGYGFVTRYGHLKKISVKVGQTLTFHQKVGEMGSSGRSTGSHVHYEVIFDGKTLDPQKFMKAGRYVFKTEDAG